MIQWILSSSRSLWVGERCHTLCRIRRVRGTVRSCSACGPHLGRLYTCLSAKLELIDLSLKLIKPCSYSFVDIRSNRARRDRSSDEFALDRRKSFISTKRELVSSRRPRRVLIIASALQHVVKATEASRSTIIHITSSFYTRTTGLLGALSTRVHTKN